MATLHSTITVTHTVRIALAPDERFLHTLHSGDQERIVTAVVFKFGTAWIVAHKTGAEYYTPKPEFPGWLAELFEQHKAKLAELRAAVDAVDPMPLEVTP